MSSIGGEEAIPTPWRVTSNSHSCTLLHTALSLVPFSEASLTADEGASAAELSHRLTQGSPAKHRTEQRSEPARIEAGEHRVVSVRKRACVRVRRHAPGGGLRRWPAAIIGRHRSSLPGHLGKREARAARRWQPPLLPPLRQSRQRLTIPVDVLMQEILRRVRELLPMRCQACAQLVGERGMCAQRSLLRPQTAAQSPNTVGEKSISCVQLLPSRAARIGSGPMHALSRPRPPQHRHGRSARLRRRASNAAVRSVAGPRVCSECGQDAKYTCPGCQAQTCSLPCSRGASTPSSGAIMASCVSCNGLGVPPVGASQPLMCKHSRYPPVQGVAVPPECAGHKDRTKCTGKRKRTGYVTLDAYDEATLISDYHLLQDTGVSVAVSSPCPQALLGRVPCILHAVSR